MDLREKMIYQAVLKVWANISSPKLTPSERKFLSKISLNVDKLQIERIIPRKCERENCSCNGLHWSIFTQPIEFLTQKEQNKLFTIAGRF